MIRLQKDLVCPPDGTITLEFVRRQLQNAIVLEHATIPTYLTAYYSVKPDAAANQEAAAMVRSVVIEEMLHMTLAANVLNAIGGKPMIDSPAFVPKFPGPLPGGVHEGFKVSLTSLSKDSLKDIYMVIEEPEDPLDFEAAPLLSAPPDEVDSFTIGEFYTSIKQHLRELVAELGEAAVFSGEPSRQFFDQQWFRSEAKKVDDLKSAYLAIDTIIVQGEGSRKSPLDDEGDLAHFYKFSELYEGRKLIRTQSTGPVEQQWEYAGEPILLDPDGIYPLVENAHLDMYPTDSPAYVQAREFNGSYTKLLKALHRTFNGDPGYLDSAIGLMYHLTVQAQSLVQLTLKDGRHAAPPFEYQAADGVAPAKAVASTIAGNPFAFNEIITASPETLATSFYSKLFQWNIEPLGNGFWGISTDGGKTLQGGIATASSEPGYAKAVTFYVKVADVQAALDQACSLGASVVMEPTQVPLRDQRVEIAMFRDPQDNVVGLIRDL